MPCLKMKMKSCADARRLSTSDESMDSKNLTGGNDVMKYLLSMSA